MYNYKKSLKSGGVIMGVIMARKMFISVTVASCLIFITTNVVSAGGRHRHNRSGRTAAFATIGAILGVGLVLSYLNKNKKEETERKVIDREYDMQEKQAELNAALAAPNALGDKRERSTVDQTLPGKTVLHAPLVTSASYRVPTESVSLQTGKTKTHSHERVAPTSERNIDVRPFLPDINNLRELRLSLPLSQDHRNERMALSMGIEEVEDPKNAAYSKREISSIIGNLKSLYERNRDNSLDDLITYLEWVVR